MSTNTNTIPLWINGQEVPAADAASTFKIVSPRDSSELWDAASVTLDQANQAAQAAAAAFPAWSKTKPIARRTILLRAADLIETRADELMGYMKQEVGAQEFFPSINISITTEILRDTAGRISGALTGSLPVCQENDTHAMVVKEPYGVVLAIAPWNAPFILGFRSVLFALAAGNTCVLKGSEYSPKCHWAIGSIFKEAGLPDGCLNVIYHRPDASVAAEITNSLIAHPAVKKINFTGSSKVGSIIASTAGKHMKPVLMELGGKASAIVCEDADLEFAAEKCALAGNLHSGQVCMATERVLVHKDVCERFTELLKEKVIQIFGGQPSVAAQATTLEKNREFIEDAISKGASLLHEETKPAGLQSDHYIGSKILTGVNKSMLIYGIESFGPNLTIHPVSSDEEALEIANDTEYGLNSAVFSRDLARALSLARRIECGAVHINEMTVHDEASLPHGGVKKSGMGRFNADAGLNEFLRTKTITFKMP